MKIGVDLDGTISNIDLYNPNLKMPWCLFVLLIPWILFVSPNKKAVKKLRLAKYYGNKIIIISARPEQITRLTENWLKFHQIPFDKLFCVGFGKGTKQRKLEIITKEGIELFIDNDKHLIDFLKQNSSIKAFTQFQ